ncbi:hypothetical protein COV20_00870 [Candidatus Woesearchaeota archaeon CG10_big_fil_rev_8_21_14_0_10_45_16]|nr:MAG: hypothetical protein COV20_00870 [Candidatus Woesearchaeota archaeon CG10_big_fil_rev_8_21_14_0_10_45_16]
MGNLEEAISRSAVCTLPIDIPMNSFNSLTFLDRLSDVARRMAYSEEETVHEKQGNVAKRLYGLLEAIQHQVVPPYHQKSKPRRTLPALIEEVPDDIDVNVSGNIGIILPQLFRWVGSTPEKFAVSVVGPKEVYDNFEGEVFFAEELNNQVVDISLLGGKASGAFLNGPYFSADTQKWFYNRLVGKKSGKSHEWGYVLEQAGDDYDWSQHLLDINLKRGPYNYAIDMGAFRDDELRKKFSEAQNKELQPFLYNIRVGAHWLDSENSIVSSPKIDIYRDDGQGVILIKLSIDNNKLFDTEPLSFLYQRLLPQNLLQVALSQHRQYLADTSDSPANYESALRRYTALERTVSLGEQEEFIVH